MKINFLNKAGVWFALFAMSSTQAIYAHHSSSHHSHHSHSHHSHHSHCSLPIPFPDQLADLDQGRADFNTIGGDLNQIFLVENINGATPATSAVIAGLVSALNGTPTSAGSISHAATDFGTLLQSLGVTPVVAQNVTTALNTFAADAEIYSGTVALLQPFALQLAALQAWEAEGVVLAATLETAIGAPVGSTPIFSLINQLIIAQANVIQNDNVANFGTANFPIAVQQNAVAHALLSQISDFVILSLIQNINGAACPLVTPTIIPVESTIIPLL